MKWSAPRRIVKEDLKGSVPSWVENLLSPLNQVLEQLTLLANQNINFSENFASTEIVQTFTHGVEREINPNSSRRVKGVLALDATGEAVSGVKRQTKTNGNQLITVYFQSGAGTASVRLALLFE